MNSDLIEQKILDCYRVHSLHCAEAICKTTVEHFCGETGVAIHKLATGFGGGVGRSHGDICGALSGGVLALGWLYREERAPCDGKSGVMALSAELRRRFIEKFGSSCCPQILEAFGPQENGQRCKELTATTTKILIELLEQGAASSSGNTP